MEKLHHANIIAGKEDCRSFIFEILAKDLNFNIKANPDFLLMENQIFGIDDARNLKRWVAGKPLISGIKVSLIITKSVTHEAQNALLKVLEEPPAGTYIFMSLESLGGLLPTFISRVVVLIPPISVGSGESIEKNIDSTFLHSDIKKRLSVTRAFLKNADRADIKKLIENLENICHESYAEGMANDTIKTKAMKNILTAKIFASARGASPKMVLEWLSCVLPSSEF